MFCIFTLGLPLPENALSLRIADDFKKDNCILSECIVFNHIV